MEAVLIYDLKNSYLKLKKKMFESRGKLNWTSIAEEWIRKHL